jgi:hypothetical protein
MATPKKRYKYTFLYQDGTYITYELTKEDYEKVLQRAHTEGVAVISIGFVNLQGIRSVIEQKEEEEQEVEVEQPLENIPVLDQESYEWLKSYVGGDK